MSKWGAMQATQLPCFQMLIDRLGSGETDKIEVLMLHQLFQSLMLARLEARRNNAADPIRSVPDHIYTLIRGCDTIRPILNPLLFLWVTSPSVSRCCSAPISVCGASTSRIYALPPYSQGRAEGVPACPHGTEEKGRVAVSMVVFAMVGRLNRAVGHLP